MVRRARFCWEDAGADPRFEPLLRGDIFDLSPAEDAAPPKTARRPRRPLSPSRKKRRRHLASADWLTDPRRRAG